MRRELSESFAKLAEHRSKAVRERECLKHVAGLPQVHADGELDVGLHLLQGSIRDVQEPSELVLGGSSVAFGDVRGN